VVTVRKSKAIQFFFLKDYTIKFQETFRINVDVPDLSEKIEKKNVLFKKFKKLGS